MYAPIVLFVYNRPWHTQQTIEALQKNELADQSELFIYSDGEKTPNDSKVAEVREYIKTISGFKKITIIESPINKGLADSVIDGVTSIINRFGKIIVLEDDLITSPYFLKFLNDGLVIYENESNIYSINGYMFNIKTDRIDNIISPLACSSWGWGTWINKWKRFQKTPKFVNEIYNSIYLNKWFNFADYDFSVMLKNPNSWAVKWYYSLKIINGLGVFPTKSLVQNIGFDDSGINCSNNNEIYQGIHLHEINIEKKEEIDLDFFDKMLHFFSSNLSKTKQIHQKQTVKGMLKNKISNFILKILNSKIVLAKLNYKYIQENLNELKIKEAYNNVTVGENSKLYEQARVFNFQNKRYNILIGYNTHIRGELVIFPSGGKISIGNYCFVGELTKIWSQDEIIIGNNVLIAHNVNIHDTNSHPTDFIERREDYKTIITTGFPLENKNIVCKKIIIEDDVWIGFNSIILKGVTIGKQAIVASGSVVVDDVPEKTIVAGNPAKVIKRL